MRVFLRKAIVNELVSSKAALKERRLRLVRYKVKPRPMVVHDANEYLKSDPLSGAGVPSSFPAFEAMMNSYYSGKRIQRVPYEKTLTWVVRELEENAPRYSASWREA